MFLFKASDLGVWQLTVLEQMRSLKSIPISSMQASVRLALTGHGARIADSIRLCRRALA